MKLLNKSPLLLVIILFVCLNLPQVQAGEESGECDHTDFAIFAVSNGDVGSQIGTDGNPENISTGTQIFVDIETDWTDKMKEHDLEIQWRINGGTFESVNAAGTGNTSAFEYWDATAYSYSINNPHTAPTDHFTATDSFVHEALWSGYKDQIPESGTVPETVEHWAIVLTPDVPGTYELIVYDTEDGATAYCDTTIQVIFTVEIPHIAIKINADDIWHRSTSSVINANITHSDNHEPHNNVNVTLNITGNTSGWIVSPGWIQTVNFTTNETKNLSWIVTPASDAEYAEYTINISEDFENESKTTTFEILPFGSANTMLAFFLDDGFTGGDKGIDGFDFDESPIQMNDYAQTAEKCELWDCTLWDDGGDDKRDNYCSGGWNCTSWNGNACETFDCLEYTLSSAEKRIDYCSGDWECQVWNNDICEYWDCSEWSQSINEYDSYCSGGWDCSAWDSDGICQNWTCLSWQTSMGKKRDKYCTGEWDCISWNSESCDIWDCTEWSTTDEGDDGRCADGWNCSEWNGNICDKWDCLTPTSGPTAERDYYCDRWNCSTWDEDKKVCQKWDCLQWIVGAANDYDYYCEGEWNCTTWKSFEYDGFPKVTSLIPSAGSNFNISDIIEIAANVTDDGIIDTVLANITFPNSTSQLLTLTNQTLNKYNNSFTIPNLAGQYNITFIVNDTYGNLNNTETTYFVIPALDTCIYPGSGNWNVLCSDNCSITSLTNIQGNNISIIGTGTFTTTANITNFNNLLVAGDSEANRCEVYCSNGGCFQS